MSRVIRRSTHRTSLQVSNAASMRHCGTGDSAKLSSLPHQGYKCNVSV